MEAGLEACVPRVSVKGPCAGLRREGLYRPQGARYPAKAFLLLASKTGPGTGCSWPEVAAGAASARLLLSFTSRSTVPQFPLWKPLFRVKVRGPCERGGTLLPVSYVSVKRALYLHGHARGSTVHNTGTWKPPVSTDGWMDRQMWSVPTRESFQL